MEIPTSKKETKFSSPEQEIAFLRDQIEQKEQALGGNAGPVTKERLTREVISDYKAMPSEKVLTAKYRVKDKPVERFVLGLTPESHDSKVAELALLLKEKGVKNVLSILAKINDPHLEDDFDRFLVQYIKAGFPVEGFGPKNPVFRALQMTLYEIALPLPEGGERERSLKELASAMDQFYSGMLSVNDKTITGPNYFSIELADENNSDEFVFYVAVPDSKKNLFEKQIMSIFSNAKIMEKKDDYNIFESGGVALASVAELDENPIFPLKTYEQFDHDPLAVILNSFSKIDKIGEGAAIQIIIKPATGYVEKYKKALDKINKGEKVKDAIDIPESFFEHIIHFGKDLFKDSAKEKKKKEEAKNEPPKIDEMVVENIKAKISSPIQKVLIRIVASSKDEAGALEILSDIESAFNQFENTGGNKIKFKRFKKGTQLNGALREFSFRLFNERNSLPLSIKEITSLMHLPSRTENAKSAPQLKSAKSGSAPAPIGLPGQGTLLGLNKDRGINTETFILKEDRLRHFYTIGQTGTGKTTLLKNMIAQDILAGDGVCFIDPHGTDIQDILKVIPPERYEDVIYFDPGYTPRPMALNMLEYDVRFPEQKTFVVNELLSIFNKLFDMKVAGGPAFEQYFRNSALLVMEHPASGNTLLDIGRVLGDKVFRDMKLTHCQNPIIKQFWQNAEKTTGEQSLANFVPYITNKFDVFISNDIMRPIISQEQSAFNFRDIMDNKKIMLVNLSKGRLGDINSHLIGLIMVGKILMSALSRVDSIGKDMAPFYLYIDEFQNITTDSIATILSEARKYKLSLNIAHQFIAQLDEKIKDAVFGNVGSVASFRVGTEDAEFLEKQFAPVFTARDIQNLDNHNAYVKLLVNGRPVKPFNIETLSPPVGNAEQVDKLKELSYLKFGRERKDVEAEVMARYLKK